MRCQSLSAQSDAPLDELVSECRSGPHGIPTLSCTRLGTEEVRIGARADRVDISELIGNETARAALERRRSTRLRECPGTLCDVADGRRG